MPCYDEVATVSAIVDAVLAAPLVGESIIVDDGSADGTREILAALDDPACE